MTPLLIGALGLVALFVLILLQVPIGFAMIIVGVVGYALQAGWAPAVTILAAEPSGLLASVDLATVPLFLLMGTFASAAGFSRDVYNAAAALLGHRRGGLVGEQRQRRPPARLQRDADHADDHHGEADRHLQQNQCEQGSEPQRADHE